MSGTGPLLSTAWSRSLGLGTPIVSAPMGGVAGGRFADAVSRAGALGTIGMGSAGSAAKLEAQLAEFADAGAVAGFGDSADTPGEGPRIAAWREDSPNPATATGSRPFGIGMVHWGLERDPAMLDVALDARPALVSVGFATRFDWVERVHEAGCLAATQVYTAAEAVVATDAGVDVVVARGSEGGGHGDPRIGTLALLDAVLDAVGGRAGAGETPGRPGAPAVLAAGGIGSGRTLAAVLAAGADAAWIGTAFIASPEALTPESAKPVIFAATGDDTVNTSAADAALGLPWPDRFPERVIRNAFVDEWEHRVPELRADGAGGVSDGLDAFKAGFVRANAAGEHDLVPFDAGQGVGLLRESRPVADVIAEFTHEASRLLARRF